jgi:pyruvate, orthophosphate dikinase
VTEAVYRFGRNTAECGLADRAKVGLRGAYMAEMAAEGFAVPPGFIVSAAACAKLESNWAAVEDALGWLSDIDGGRYGDPAWPLLISVRPSPVRPVSGSMEAVLNLGLSDATVEGLARRTSDPRFAYDCYRRFLQKFAHVVMGDDLSTFEDITQLFLEERGYVSSAELRASDMKELTVQFKSQIESHDGQRFPQDVMQQLRSTIMAMTRAWNAPRARSHRKMSRLAQLGDDGLPLIVQVMAFGNFASASGTGRAVSRNPDTGEAGLFGEFLERAQGPDLLARLRPPTPISALAEKQPDIHATLVADLAKLEAKLRDAVEVEFTFEGNRLALLDVRPAPRTAPAALRMAVDMTKAGLMSKEQSVLAIDPLALSQLLHPAVDPTAKKDVIATGLPASPGAAFGMIVFDIEEAHRLAVQGQKVILVKTETSPEDIRGLHGAEGILTSRGGTSSHAAVIARGMGKPCVSGAGTLKIDAAAGTLTTPGGVLRLHDTITIDGTAGQVLRGGVPTLKPSLSGDFATILKWADEFRRMKIRANAETRRDAETARDFGAEGIGLVRTEHMFFEGDRIVAMREMILADKEEQPGKPVTIRLLDPPLHEFLPEDEADLENVARSLNVPAQTLRKRVTELAEQNPMLGHRGVRLLLSYPEITEMQARAIFEASAAVEKATGQRTEPEIMVPLVVTRAEMELVRARINVVAAEIARETGVEPSYFVGSMIELPRSALRAGDIAPVADFFSFGTNDLTQTTFGISRDDSSRFIGDYTSRGVFVRDPFISLDTEGVGELIEIAVERGQAARPGLLMGICGEHGGDPESIAFCEKHKLDYVSCSPFRVPIAKLAAAQATLKSRQIAESNKN